MSNDSNYIFYGRRLGRRLRAQRQGLVDQLLPQLEIKLPMDDRRIDPHGLFEGSVEDIWLEVGFGAGEHLAWQAQQYPKIGFIGAEPYINGVARMLGYVEDEDLRNVRILSNDVRPLLDALPEASIGRVFVLYPDPWPKKRHAQRRFIGPVNLPSLARIMRDGAILRVASDSAQHVRWSLFHLLSNGDFCWTANCADDWRSRPADWPSTRYETKMTSGERTPTYLEFRRMNRDKSETQSNPNLATPRK